MTFDKKRNNIIKLHEQIYRNDSHTEPECASILKELAFSLLPGHSCETVITYVNCEQTCSTGRVDMIVIAEKLNMIGDNLNVAYVWELKAPQLPVYVMETSNQACPSNHLFKAKNQLLHYHQTISNDGAWKKRWGIVSSDCVFFGGIVIGREDNFVDCKSYEPFLSRRLALQAHDIRQTIFYRSNNITLLTWDRVLTILNYQTLSHKKIVGRDTTQIEMDTITTSIIGDI